MGSKYQKGYLKNFNAKENGFVSSITNYQIRITQMETNSFIS